MRNVPGSNATKMHVVNLTRILLDEIVEECFCLLILSIPESNIELGVSDIVMLRFLFCQESRYTSNAVRRPMHALPATRKPKT
jgi:hypothetical protein